MRDTANLTRVLSGDALIGKLIFIALQGSIAARGATLPSIVLLKCTVGRPDLLPGRTVRGNTAAYWVGAKEVVGGGY